MCADRDQDIIVFGLELLDLLLGHAHAKIEPLPRDGLGQFAAELVALLENMGLFSRLKSKRIHDHKRLLYDLSMLHVFRADNSAAVFQR